LSPSLLPALRWLPAEEHFYPRVCIPGLPESGAFTRPRNSNSGDYDEPKPTGGQRTLFTSFPNWSLGLRAHWLRR